MNTVVANIIKGYTDTLPFIDKSAGLVRKVTYTEPQGEGKPAIKKSFPVACDVTHSECMSGKIMDLVPNSAYKSVSYFEDLGVSLVGMTGKGYQFKARVKQVVWLNLQKLGITDCNASALAIAALAKVVPGNTFNSPENKFTLINVSLVAIDPKTSAIFSQYTYDETVLQFLLYPYDYFGVTWEVQFTVPESCIVDWTNGIAQNCLSND